MMTKRKRKRKRKRNRKINKNSKIHQKNKKMWKKYSNKQGWNTWELKINKLKKYKTGCKFSV